MVTFLTGLVGGLVATLAMTVATVLSRDDSPLPAARFYATFVGDGTPDQELVPGMALHFAYGAVAAAVLTVVVDAVGLLGLGSGLGWLVWSVIWGVLLAAAAIVIWLRLAMQVEPDEQAMRAIGGGHVVYGVVLGVWLGLIGVP